MIKCRYAGSKIRLNGPRFLLYAIVDSIVDEVGCWALGVERLVVLSGLL